MKNLGNILLLAALTACPWSMGETPSGNAEAGNAAPPNPVNRARFLGAPPFGLPNLGLNQRSNASALNPILPAIESLPQTPGGAEEPTPPPALPVAQGATPIEIAPNADLGNEATQVPQPILESVPERIDDPMVTAAPTPAADLNPLTPRLGAAPQLPQALPNAQEQPTPLPLGAAPEPLPASLPGAPIGAPETVALGPEFAIILSDNKFYPSRVRMKAGFKTQLLFTTVNAKPAALIIERLKVQTWIPSQGKQPERTPAWEVNRELGSNRITRIPLNPQPGTYLFHDAITGASGEIVVE